MTNPAPPPDNWWSSLRPLPPLRLTGDSPTQTLPLVGLLRHTPYRHAKFKDGSEDSLGEDQLLRTLDLAARVGELILRSGGSASAAEAACVATAAAGGLSELEVDVTLSSLLMQATTAAGHPLTMLRVVRGPRPDYGRLAAVHQLVDDLVGGQIGLPQAHERIRAIARQPRTWSLWVVALAEGAIGAGVAGGLGASWFAILVCLFSGAFIARVTRRLRGKRALPTFYSSGVAGLVAVGIAWVAFTVTPIGMLHVSAHDYAAIIAGAIVALLPARALSSAVQDIILGFPVTGSSRVVEVMVNTLGLIIGIGMGLSIAMRIADALGTSQRQPRLDQISTTASSNVFLAMAAAALVGLGAAVTMQSRRRMMLPSALLGALSVAVAWVVSSLGLGPITATGVAAVGVGFVARLVALRLGAPAQVLVVPGTLSLLPGLAIFSGLYRLLMRAPDAAASVVGTMQGLQAVLTAIGVVLVVSTGVTLGDVLATPIDRGANLWSRSSPRSPRMRGDRGRA